MKPIFSTEYLNNATSSRLLFADRDVNEDMILPYGWYDVKIKPNEFVYANIINNAIDRLYDNLLYIIAKARIPQSLLPNKRNYTTFLTIAQDYGTMEFLGSVNNPGLFYSYTRPTNELARCTAGAFTEHQSLSGINSGMMFTFDFNTENCHMTLVNDGELPYGTKVVSYTDRVDNYTQRKFPYIDSIVMHKDYAYALCGLEQTVYKYDTLGLVKDDRAYNNPETETKGKLILDTIGGPGELQDGSRFLDPKCMCTTPDDHLYVIDSAGSQAVAKWFDSNGNHISSYGLFGKVAGIPVDIIFTNSKFYMLTTSHVCEFSRDWRLLQLWPQWTLEGDEYWKQIVPSKENPQVVYLSTNKNVYKKFLTKLDKGIGFFTYENRGMHVPRHQDIAFIATTESEFGEYVYVCDRWYGVIYRFNESSDYQLMMDKSFEKSFFPLLDIQIKPDEYVNSIVYNKALAKLFYNHAAVGNAVNGKAICAYDTGPSLVFQSLRYLLPEGITSRGWAPTLNNFIGMNEPVTPVVINRTLRELYDMQEALMKDIAVGVIDNKLATTSNAAAASTIYEDPYVWTDGQWIKKSVAEEDPELAEYI